MILRHFLLAAFFLLSVPYGFSQRKCASSFIHEQLRDKHPGLYQSQEEYKNELTAIAKSAKPLRTAAEEVYTIPVVVHVIYNSTPATNISDAQIQSQIDVLNEDFSKQFGTNGYNTDPLGADTKIRFCLSTVDPSGNPTTGIQRVFNSKSSWTADFSDEVLIKSLSYWPSDEYLNIWVCNMDDIYLGYAQYPTGSSLPGPSGSGEELDGVVIDYQAFGRIGAAGTGTRALYNLGRTTTHEVSHWLGLLHIWGENEINGCSSDYVSDTPLDQGPNDDANCNDVSDCDNDNLTVADMTNNYLDYSPDVCMNLFTTGQKDRMRTVLETAPRRVALLTSSACGPPLAVTKRTVSQSASLELLLSGSEDLWIEMYDLTGRKMYETVLKGNDKRIPENTVSPGLYLLKAGTSEVTISQKMYINNR